MLEIIIQYSTMNKYINKPLVIDETLKWRVIRINKPEGVKKFSEKITLWLLEKEIPQWVVGKETVPHEHYHIVIGSTTDWYGSQNKILKKEVKEYFKVDGSSFSTSSVRNTVRKTILYSIKDLEYNYNGFDDKYIKKLEKQTTTKFEKKKFGKEIQENEDRFYDETISEDQFMRNYLDIKDKYGQTPNPQGEAKYVVKHLKKKNAEYARMYFVELRWTVNRMIGKPLE